MKKFSDAVFIILWTGFILIYFYFYGAAFKADFTQPAYWLVAISWAYLILRNKPKAVKTFSFSLIFLVLGYFLTIIGSQKSGEFLLGISLIGWLLGILQKILFSK
jgi:heme O synthase-like polyprenyltransferase